MAEPTGASLRKAIAAKIRQSFLGGFVVLSLSGTGSQAVAVTFEEAMTAFDARRFTRAYPAFAELASAGHADAQFQLGLMAHRGLGTAQNYRQALEWYRRAAEQGHAGAQNNLGVMYRRGESVRENNVLAYMWFSLSAAQFDSKAKENRDSLAFDMSEAEVLEAQQLTADYMSRLWARVRSQQTPAGYWVQIGLFSDARNVERIEVQLEKESLDARTEAVSVGGRTYERVRVGPFADEGAAEAVALRIDRMFRVRSAVVPVSR